MAEAIVDEEIVELEESFEKMVLSEKEAKELYHPDRCQCKFMMDHKKATRKTIDKVRRKKLKKELINEKVLTWLKGTMQERCKGSVSPIPSTEEN